MGCGGPVGKNKGIMHCHGVTRHDGGGMIGKGACLLWCVESGWCDGSIRSSQNDVVNSKFDIVGTTSTYDVPVLGSNSTCRPKKERLYLGIEFKFCGSSKLLQYEARRHFS